MNPIRDKRIDRWQRLQTATAEFQIERIEIIESNVFASQTVDLNRVTALVGAHGSGKTYFLRMIDAAFGYEPNSSTPPFSAGSYYLHKTSKGGLNGRIRVTVRHNSEIVTKEVNLSDSRSDRAENWKDIFGSEFGAWYTSAPEAFDSLQMYYQENSFVKDQVDRGGLEVFRYSADDLRGLTNILFKTYEEVEIHTVFTDSGDYAPGSELPHVVCRGSGSQFDLTMMSSGEVWVHYLLGWHFHLARHEPVLIDEPESFLAARGHRALIDEVGRRTLRNGNQVILATHSEGILSRFPLESIRMCVPSRLGVRILAPNSMVQIRDSIGIESHVRAVVLVEDYFAKRVLLQICSLLDHALPREIEIVDAGGESEVISGVRALRKSENLPHIGVVDGDVGSRVKRPLPDRCFALPGCKSPEAELAGAAEARAESFGARINRSAFDVQSALAASDGVDHQYWPARFALQLGHNDDVVLHALVGEWLADREVHDNAAIMVSEIRSLVDGSAAKRPQM